MWLVNVNVVKTNGLYDVRVSDYNKNDGAVLTSIASDAKDVLQYNEMYKTANDALAAVTANINELLNSYEQAVNDIDNGDIYEACEYSMYVNGKHMYNNEYDVAITSTDLQRMANEINAL